MRDEPTRRRREVGRQADGPPQRLVDEARASLRATAVYVHAIADRLDFAVAIDPEGLERVPADSLIHLVVVSDALQDAARHTLWFVDPEAAGKSQVLAGLERDRIVKLPPEPE
jgi:hypothetical protein